MIDRLDIHINIKLTLTLILMLPMYKINIITQEHFKRFLYAPLYRNSWNALSK